MLDSDLDEPLEGLDNESDAGRDPAGEDAPLQTLLPPETLLQPMEVPEPCHSGWIHRAVEEMHNEPRWLT